LLVFSGVRISSGHFFVAEVGLFGYVAPVFIRLNSVILEPAVVFIEIGKTFTETVGMIEELFFGVENFGIDFL